MQTEIGLQMDGTVRPSGGNTVSSSPMEKWISTDSQMAKSFEFPDSYMIQDQNVNLSLEKYSVGVERAAGHSLCRPLDHDTGSRSNFNTQVASHFMGGYKINTRDAHYENSLFSSSLSELFSRKLRLSSTDPLFGHSFGAAASHYEEDEPFESIEEIEAQTIGNLLPNDDDLLSGVTDRLDYIAQPNNGDDIEELDLFSSVGGMDLGEDGSSPGESNSEFTRRNSNGQLGGSSSSIAGEHPSRTLFVRNINSNVEDSELRSLFERYGDIRTLYTACKHRGFVMISYYDIRAAQNAMKALQDKPLRHRRLDIHFSIPKDNPSEKYINHGTLVIFNLDSSVSNDELHKIFGVYGEIKEIHETPHKSNRKYVEFYDVRDADAVLCVLNGSDIAGKRIKIEPSHPGGARRLVQPYASELEQDESALYLQHSSPPTNLTTSGFSGAVSEGGIMSSSMDNGTILGVHSANGAPVSPFLENAFHHGISSSVPSSLPSLVRVGNQSRVTESVHSQGQRKFEFQGMPNFHPHSLPEYPDGFAGAPGNSPGNLAVNITARPVDRIKNRQFCRVSLNGLDLNEGVFGTSGNGSCPSPGQNYMWSNLHRPQPQGMIWRNSPPFATHPLPQLHGVPRTPSHMLNTLFPISYQHVGSAPSVTSLWDRRHAYAAPDASVFHPGSLGNLGISANTVHPVEPVPHNMFPGSGGNCMDLPFPSTNFGFNSHQRCLIFPTRGQMIPMMNSIDSPNDWTRNCNKPVNKKQFELEIDRIVREEDKRTTLMIKNIPNKYTSKMLLAAIDERHRGTYDFFYLPIDFKNKCNVGYAFINMTDPPLIIPFYQAFNGKKWEKFNSEKVASLAYARIQGKAALIAHFQNSSLMNEDKRCRPILFHTDGPNAGDQVPFPMGVTVRPRPSKNRGSTSEESNQESLPNLANGEKSSNEDSSSGSTKDLD